MPILDLPRECYANKDAENQMRSESSDRFEIESIDFENEILLNIKGAQFPYKSYVSHETLWATNMVKSIFIEGMKLLSSKRFIIPLILSFVSIKNLQELLHSFNWLSWRILSPYYLKDRHLSPVVKEIHLAVFTFLMEIGIREDISDKFATTFCHLIEYDDAYKIRIKDLVGETTKEMLIANPRKEIKWLMSIHKERDSAIVSKKFSQLASIISYSMVIPKVKKAFIKAINEIDLNLMLLDDIDIYWATYKKDYKLKGLSWEERQEFAKVKGWFFPEKAK